MPKSWMICRAGFDPRAHSAETSSYCRSSIMPFSLSSSSSGLDTGSLIMLISGLVVLRAHGLGQLQFLQLLLDGDRVLRLGDDFLARDHARQVLVNQETVERDHAPL